MRLAYLALKFTLKFSLWVYYPRTRKINEPTKRFARTIFVSNHAASFMDPLVVASNQKPIVFFMTRADVFKPIMMPILWAAHMLPIYRAHDGEDTKKKNEEVFEKCNKILKNGRSLLIFGEGFTDDVFIRRLKPLKKGAARIGFGALEKINWSKNIYIQTVGVNYTEPNKFGSGTLISNGDPICLNDYRKEYEENPNKVINHLTQHIEKDLRSQLTHVDKKEWAPFHENVMRLTRKGMNPDNFDKKYTLVERWKYSQQLANWLNEQDLENDEQLIGLKKDTDRYFALLKRSKLDEKYMFNLVSEETTRYKDLLFLILSLPVTLLGLIHGFIPYIITKKFVENTMKRKVFWSSVKMMVGHILMGLYNIGIVMLINALFIKNTPIAWAYFFLVPMLSGLIAYKAIQHLKDYKIKSKLAKQDVSTLVKMRKDILEKIGAIIPVA
ncbi:1-acyl-sn-glycerol-3-phosphate acyltransferase [Lishizhenia tianjinensis]|uniref:1-acyl-sn-glycerol-3-phosphate acyltransferase n=1 Tax=Lishizhenia tianjinensis TaxID=477690 RepID=A0A1I7BMG2_9FLAO|nr:1-acyl-sn-glycerol-3-phosphate acyltransferase [Lishizhenia tianjinensis]SFT88370.1 1-acyl-sn-glycerol-3-phosphate acyltransferase [Lishizhenia tianjinensis]